jgi:Uma2 family endonuclease
MVMETAFRSEELFTQEEFWLWLEQRRESDVNRYELINGRIVMSPPAKFRHGFVEGNLHRLIAPSVHAAGSGITLGSSAGFDLPTGDTLEPDFSFISRERWQAGPQPSPGDKGFTRIVPDLAIEILSATSVRRDRIEKRLIYARCGVREYWLIDPTRGEIALFTSLDDRFGEPQVLTSGEIVSRVLPDLRIRVEDVLAEPG